MALTTTPMATADTASGRNARNAPPPMMVKPFVQGSFRYTQPMVTTSGLGFAAVLTDQKVPAYGYLRFLRLRIQATGGLGAGVIGNTTHGVTPFGIIQSLQLKDTNGNPIIGPIDGYSLFLLNNWRMGPEPVLGGSQFVDGFSDISAVGGNFELTLDIPIEISGRDALGALPNLSAQQAFRLDLTLRSSASFYTVAPATLPTLTVTAELHAWAPPAPLDVMGNPQEQTPPEIGTTMNITRQVYNVVAGDNTIQLVRMGNLMRLLGFVHKNVAGLPADANLPPSIIVIRDGTTMFEKRMGSIRATNQAESQVGSQAGSWFWSFADDLDGVNGYEARQLYMPTTPGTLVTVRFTAPVAGSLDCLTVDVIPSQPSIIAAG